VRITFGKDQLRKIPASTIGALSLMCATALPSYVTAKETVINVDVDRVIDHVLFWKVTVLDIGFLLSAMYLTIGIFHKYVIAMREKEDAEYRSELQRLDIERKEYELEKDMNE